MSRLQARINIGVLVTCSLAGPSTGTLPASGTGPAGTSDSTSGQTLLPAVSLCQADPPWLRGKGRAEGSRAAAWAGSSGRQDTEEQECGSALCQHLSPAASGHWGLAGTAARLEQPWCAAVHCGCRAGCPWLGSVRGGSPWWAWWQCGNCWLDG